MSSSYQWRGHARMAVREPLSTPTPNISPHIAAKEAQWPSLSSSTRAAASPQSPAPAAPQPVTPVGCQSVAVVITSQVLPPQALWERHRTAMAEDIMHEQGCSQVASYCTLSRYHAACASCARCVSLNHPYENLHACIEVCLCISLGWASLLFFNNTACARLSCPACMHAIVSLISCESVHERAWQLALIHVKECLQTADQSLRTYGMTHHPCPHQSVPVSSRQSYHMTLRSNSALLMISAAM